MIDEEKNRCPLADNSAIDQQTIVTTNKEPYLLLKLQKQSKPNSMQVQNAMMTTSCMHTRLTLFWMSLFSIGHVAYSICNLPGKNEPFQSELRVFPAMEVNEEDLHRLRTRIASMIPLDSKACSFNHWPGYICTWYVAYSREMDVRKHPAIYKDPELRDIAVYVTNPCFTTHSMGNDFGMYAESMLCAHLSGTHFIAPVFVDPTSSANVSSPFFRGLPTVMLNPLYTPNSSVDKVASVCRTDWAPWQETMALIHTNIDFVNDLFRMGIEDALQSALHWIPASNISSKTHTLGSPWKNSSSNATYIKGKFLPVPDVAIHYRCGDNSKISGLLPLSAIEYVLNSTLAAATGFAIRRIYIMAEDENRQNPNPGAAQGRSFEPQKRRCGIILHRLKARIVQLLTVHQDHDVHVAVLRGQDMIHDLVRLAYAPVTICSASTFCLWPALAKAALHARIRNGSATSPHVPRVSDVQHLATYVPTSSLFAGCTHCHYNLTHFHWIAEPPLVYFEPYHSDEEINWPEVLKRLENPDVKVVLA